MEKFLYISILLFINVAFIFRSTKGQACSIHTDAKCRDACDRTFIINGQSVRCCQGGGDRGLWTNICREGQCTPDPGYVYMYTTKIITLFFN